jgi:uncharacterized damage-inducible protein DinB
MKSDKETREIIKTLRDIYAGEPWHGPNIKSVVESIPASQLFNRYGTGHSLIELIFHMIAWRRYVIRRLKEEPENGKIDNENWIDLKHQDYPDLKRIIKNLDETQEELERLLDSVNDTLLSKVVEGKNYTLRKMLNGLIHHDLYHLGQISLLKK